MREEPVITRTEAPQTRDVLNPSVVRASPTPNPQPLTPGFFNLYSAFDGHTWRTVLATSADGIAWNKHGVVLAPDPQTWEGSYIAANGSAFFDGQQFWYWYQSGDRDTPRIGLARSADGRSWRKESRPVLETGPRGAWDERGVGDPNVIRLEPYWYMFYLGQDRARQQRLGVARSRNGVAWEKLRTNPFLELGEPGTFDENGLGEPAVWTAHGFYWMLYTGRDVTENRRLGLARSADGVHWQRMPVVFAGSEPWDSKVICDPAVMMDGDEVRVWFGGGNVARPDENLNGQIGYAVLRPVNATLTK